MQVMEPTLVWNQEQTSTEVQNRDISGPIKSTDVIQKIFKKKKIFLHDKAHCFHDVLRILKTDCETT